MPQQSYSNHARFDPKFHFVLIPMIITLLVCSSVLVYHAVTLTHLMALLGAIALLLTALTARMYALQVQDRLIRLEESLRLQSLGGSAFGLSARQCVGLRFAADDEVVVLAARAVREQMTTKQIKQAVREWRADEFRV